MAQQTGMKLYTEEQVIKLTHAAFAAGQNHNSFIFEDEFKNITPIELPSDEEIEKNFTIGISPQTSYPHMIKGAKWMKEQILKQNK